MLFSYLFGGLCSLTYQLSTGELFLALDYATNNPSIHPWLVALSLMSYIGVSINMESSFDHPLSSVSIDLLVSSHLVSSGVCCSELGEDVWCVVSGDHNLVPQGAQHGLVVRVVPEAIQLDVHLRRLCHLWCHLPQLLRQGDDLI